MSTRDAMRRLISPGSYVLFLFFLAGIWLTISPFAMTTQPSGSHWIASTINNVTIGALMMVVSLLGILGYMLFALRDLIRETQAKQAVEQQASQLAE
jgi:TRAP-type C4-dicarboxylate transport system permease small subunit